MVARVEGQQKGYREYYREIEEYLDEGRYLRARTVSDQLLSQLDEGRFWWPWFVLVGAEVRLRQGEIGAAHEYLDRLLDVVGERDDGEELGCDAAGVRADLYLAEGRVDLAITPAATNLTMAERLLRAGEDAGDSTVRDAARSRQQGASARGVRLELARGRHRDAVARIEALLEDESLYPPGTGARASLLLLAGLAKEQLALGAEGASDGDALGDAAQTLEEARDGLSSLPLVSARLALGRLLLDREDVAAARAELEAAEIFLEGFGSPSDETPLAIEEEVAALAARVVMASPPQSGALASARERLERAVERRLVQWSRLPERPGGRGVLHYRERRAPLGALIPLQVAMEGMDEGSRSALTLLFRVQAQGTLSRLVEASAPTVDQVEDALLGPRDGLLVYLVVARKSYVIALDRDGAVTGATAGMHQIARARREYLSHHSAVVADSKRPSAWAIARERSLAQRLATTLLPPEIVARIAGWRSVGVIGLDPVGRVPFEWLPVGDGPYLGIARAVYHVPSAPFAVTRARARDEVQPGASSREYVLVGGTLLGEAVARQWPELEPLPLTFSTSRRLLLNYPPGRGELMEAERATTSTLLAEDLHDVGVLQLLVHAVYDASRDRPVFLVLSPGDPSPGDAPEADHGLFGSDHVDRMSAPRCVLMASCRSGVGPDRRGDDGSADMAGAWLGAGADAVLASQSDLRYGPTIDITESLQQSLRRDGVGLAEALRRGLAQVTDERGDEAPFHAGLLHVAGLGLRPVFPGGGYSRATSSAERAGARTRPGGFAELVAPYLLAGFALVAVVLHTGLARQRRRRSSWGANR